MCIGCLKMCHRSFDRDQNNGPEAINKLGVELVHDIIPFVESKYRWIGEFSSGRISFLDLNLREAILGLLNDSAV